MNAYTLKPHRATIAFTLLALSALGPSGDFSAYRNYRDVALVAPYIPLDAYMSLLAQVPARDKPMPEPDIDLAIHLQSIGIDPRAEYLHRVITEACAIDPRNPRSQWHADCLK